jgi:hypothetical protein
MERSNVEVQPPPKAVGCNVVLERTADKRENDK